MDHGKLSTYLIGAITIIYGFVVSNPEITHQILENLKISGYEPLIIAIIAFLYDYTHPRNEPE